MVGEQGGPRVAGSGGEGAAAASALFASLREPLGARSLRRMAEGGELSVLLPFVASWAGFDQGSYHAHDLLEHSLRAAEAAEDLAADPGAAGLPGPQCLADHLGEELEEGVTRAALLKLSAFLHDIAKPEALTLDGARRRFLGHEVRGGHQVRRLLAELGVGRRARAAAQRVVAVHLRLYGLAHQEPPTRAARMRYLRDLRAEAPEAILLSLADERATGPAPRCLEAVLRTGRELLALHWELRDRREVAPLLRGRDLVEALGVSEGPEVGRILRRVNEAEARGEVGTRDGALALARKLAREGRG